MVESPDVSVIVPVFNAGDGLEASLQSLLDQTLKNIEIIVVNDASTDRSAETISRLESENGNILAIHLAENQGVHEARLAGLKKASAPWIGFLDADDFARPTMFEAMHRAAEKHDVDIVVCGSYRVTKERKPVAPKIRFKSSKKIASKVFEKFSRFEFGTGSLCNKLYHREVMVPYADMHFPWRQNLNEDLLLNIGCFYKAESVYVTHEVLHEYVLNESSVTSTTNNAKAYVYMYRAYALAVSSFSELGGDVIVRIINMYRAQLSWSSYIVADARDIEGYEEELKEATELIYRSYPLALALLPSRQPPARVGAKVALKALARKGKSLLGLDAIVFKPRE